MEIGGELNKRKKEGREKEARGVQAEQALVYNSLSFCDR